MEQIITSIAIAFIMPIVFSLIYKRNEKEEKKLNTEGEYKVTVKSSLRYFFLGWMILCLLSAIILPIVLTITDKEHTTLITILWMDGILLFFFFVGLTGYVISKYHYFIVKKESILTVKGFRKTEIPFSKMKYISKVSNLAYTQVFDENYIPLFGADGSYVGIEALQKTLEELNLTPYKKPDVSTLKSNPAYRHYNKKVNLILLKWISLGFGLATILLFGIMKSQLHYTVFENYKIEGIVEAWKRNEESLEIQLENEETKRVNNIIYKKLDKNIYEALNKGQEITLYLYTKDSKYISQIEIDEFIYLSKEDSEKLEKSNYETGIIASYVFISIGAVLITTGICASILLFVIVRKENSNFKK